MPTDTSKPASPAGAIEARCFAANVRTLRNSTGLSQQRFGEMVEMHQSEISSIEAGKGNPMLDTVARIASAFGMRARDLLRD